MTQPGRPLFAHAWRFLTACAVVIAGCSDHGPSTGPEREGLLPGAPHIVVPLPPPGDEFPPPHDSHRLFVPRQIGVIMAPGETPDALNASFGTTTLAAAPPIDAYLLLAPAQASLAALIRLVNDFPGVEAADYNWLLQSPESEQASLAFNDGRTSADYHDQAFLDRLEAEAAHSIARGNGVLVATIDTGVDFSHPDLSSRIATNGYDFVSDDGIPEDEADGIDQDQDGMIDEAAGHGTHVCGLVLLGAPEARILPVRVLDNEGWGNSFMVAQGILYAAEEGADVINMSLGMTGNQPQLEKAVRWAAERDVVLVASAGNGGHDAPNHYPAGSIHVIAVAATDSEDHIASFSNYGQHIDICAPGVGILSTYLNGGYAVWSGTSMAAPLCSAGLALILSLDPGAAPEFVRKTLRSGADDIVSLNPEYAGRIGAGRVNLRVPLEIAGGN